MRSPYSLRIRIQCAASIILTAIMSLAAPRPIVIENNTDQPAFAATYDGSGKRTSGPLEIAAHTAGTLNYKPSPPLSLSDPFISAGTSTKQLPEKSGAPLHSRTSLSKDVTTIIIDTLGTELGTTAQNTSDTITVHNKSEQKVWVALYYDDGKQARRWGAPRALEAGGVIPLLRPERKCKHSACVTHYDRNLYFASAETVLTPLLTNRSQPSETSALLGSTNIGSLKGSDIFIFEAKGKLKGVNATSWNARTAQATIKNMITPQLDKIRADLHKLEFPGKNTPAVVTFGSGLSAEEERFREKRFTTALRPACEKLYKARYGIDLPRTAQLPTIALCTSGGGCRAMIATAGFTAALEQLQLLPLFTYFAALSGSSWYLACWIYSALSAQRYYADLVSQLQYGITNKFALEQIQQAVLQKNAFDKPVSFIDVYGALLADKFVKPYAPARNPNHVFWGAPWKNVESAEVPFPLCAAITPKVLSATQSSRNPFDYYWISFDPYYTEILTLDASVQSWALGRSFAQRSSQTAIPPLQLSTLLGIWGSAMSVNMHDLGRIALDTTTDHILAIITRNDILKYLVKQRASPAKIPNFLTGSGLMTFVDAGIAFNLPLPLLMKKERAVDIIVALDCSSPIKSATALQLAQDYLQALKIPFPPLNLREADSKPYSIFWNHTQKDMPVLIYLPLIAHHTYKNNWNPASASFTNTFNFTYTKAQAQLLGGLGERMAQDLEQALIETIVTWIHERLAKE